MVVTNPEEIAGLRRAGLVAAQTLKAMQAQLRPGISTAELDQIAGQIFAQHGAHSAPRLCYDFPGETCISLNDIAAHGIPGPTVIQRGDLVNIDVSLELDGFYADMGASTLVNPGTNTQRRLLEAVQGALWKAIRGIRAGKPLNVVGKAIQSEAQRCNFRLVPELTGHGVGRSLHEDPQHIPNYDDPNDKRLLKEGMVLAIEAFMTTGLGRIFQDKGNGWSLCTIDHHPVAQFEHTVLVTSAEAIILTHLA